MIPLTESRLRGPFLTEYIRCLAEEKPEQLALRFLRDDGREKQLFSFGALDLKARTIAAYLQDRRLSGKRALLLHSPGLSFVSSFLGCLYANVIAVPAYFPHPYLISRSYSRLKSMLEDAQPSIALTSEIDYPSLERLFQERPDLARIPLVSIDNLSPEIASDYSYQSPCSDSTAFIQYTSGSTSAPKGVVVSHGNIRENTFAINRAWKMTPNEVTISWLPLSHDMGLIGMLLTNFMRGAQVVFMSPIAFLKRPFIWLEAISRYQAAISGGPSFGYQLCVRKIDDEVLETLNLSAWRIAFNGSERVRASTLDQFSDKFKRSGFKRSAFLPCYGMAEATLYISGDTSLAGPHSLVVDGEALGRGFLEPVKEEAPTHTTLVSCGTVGDEVRIVDPTTCVELKAGQVGEIWFQSGSVARGYWRQPELSKTTFQAKIASSEETPFLRTGDLGAIFAGELFVVGRLKDLIIIDGKNHAPDDIEKTVEDSDPAIRPGCVAAFSIDFEEEEVLAIVAEVDHRELLSGLDELKDKIRQSVFAQRQVGVQVLLIVRKGIIPKTSSGKVQRNRCKALLEDSQLRELSI